MGTVVSLFVGVIYFFVLMAVIAACCVVSVIAAKRLCADKGLSSGLMWLGIAGWVGLIILCFIKKPEAVRETEE